MRCRLGYGVGTIHVNPDSINLAPVVVATARCSRAVFLETNDDKKLEEMLQAAEISGENKVYEHEKTLCNFLRDKRERASITLFGSM